MQKFLIVFFVLFSFAQSSSAQDKFNSQIWNRKNHERGTGQVDKEPWYEWWYYKIILPKSDDAFYFVYGIVNPWDIERGSEASRATVEAGDFKNKFIINKVYTPAEYYSAYNKTHVEIGSHLATDKNIKGRMVNARGQKIAWDFTIEKLWRWNAMGWMMPTGITNISWYPAQADARCTGWISSNGRRKLFSKVPCYQDRNWGTSLPKWWTWIVSNKFENSPQTALAIGGGQPITFGNIHRLASVTVGFKYKGKVYDWRPNNLDQIKMNISFGKWEVVAKSLLYKIEVSAYAPREEFMDLEFMGPDGVVFHDYEALRGDLTVKFYKMSPRGWQLVEELNSQHAGIEYGSRDTYEMQSLFNSYRTLY
ncbi:MAG: hypothetical protein KDD38_07590 [Bdellovibrionales bacterium]|nr:hypothetical protein [Bdellovibrionales bacterium]